MTPIDFGAQLYQLLPAVFRERDNSLWDAEGKMLEAGDLARLLSAQGVLLDKIYRTLLQRLYDHFPDQADEDAEGLQRSCQSWLLPYIGQLLDVRLVSPDEAAQRAEVSNAVAWRQRKGTLVCIEQIAQAVGGFEVEVQEGWRCVITTPRIGDPLLPATYYGEATDIPSQAVPQLRARHPGLKAATLDLRRPSRAIVCDPNNPAARSTRFGDTLASWRQLNRHGIPCFPDSFQDVSARTVDVRTPDWRHGHVHPRRVQLHTPIPEGFCSAYAASVSWSSIKNETDYTDTHIEITSGEIEWNGLTLPLRCYKGLGKHPVKLNGVVDLEEPAVYRFENLWLNNRLDVKEGKVELYRCASRLTLVQTAETNHAVIEARECLFRRVEAAWGLVQLEYCTVLDRVVAECLNASDSIIPRPLKDRTDNDVPRGGCIRYSALPDIPSAEMISDGVPSMLRINGLGCSHEAAIFFNSEFGRPGCGVLHPATPITIRTGAEDGGEMGAYHGMRYNARQAAVLDKLQDFLPVGIEAMLIPDSTLSCTPPEL